jgi:hypothetical protein
MSTSHLVILPTPEAPEPPGDKIRRLKAEARAVAYAHMQQLITAIAEVTRLSGEIAEGGEFYPVGARELCRRLVHETERHAFSLSALIERA